MNTNLYTASQCAILPAFFFLCEENFLNFYFLSSKSLMLVVDC